MATEVELEEEMETKLVKLGSYEGKVRLLIVGEESESESAAEETMFLWGIQSNAYVAQSSLNLRIDACGHSLSILQSTSSLFLEHAVDSGMLFLLGNKIFSRLFWVLKLSSSICLRLRLLKKNIEANLRHGDLWGSAIVKELSWGDGPGQELIQPLPDYGLDVIYSEGAVVDLLDTPSMPLCGNQTTIFLVGELRNDTVLEYFLEAAMKDFVIGRVDQTQWHQPSSCDVRRRKEVKVEKQVVNENFSFIWERNS